MPTKSVGQWCEFSEKMGLEAPAQCLAQRKCSSMVAFIMTLARMRPGGEQSSGNRGSDCLEVDGGGSLPGRTGSESPRPSGSTEPCSVHFIHWSGIYPHGLGTAREAALPEHSTRGTFPMPSVYPQVPAQGLLRDF